MSTAKFTRAIVREIPDSLRDHSEHIKDIAENADPEDPEWGVVDLEKARKEHEAFTQTFRDLGLEVTVMPADERLPDCPFVEDICVIVGDRALMTAPSTENRDDEIDDLYQVLTDLGLEVHETLDPDAQLEGGDVFFTGHEFFVGESISSNSRGRRQLARTFPEYPVHAVPLAEPEYHLKGVACIAAPGVIAVTDNEWGQAAWKTIQKKAKFQYEPLWLPDRDKEADKDDHTCDCIYFNGNLIHCTEDEGPKAVKVFAEKFPHLNLVPVSLDELGRVDAGLSCCCLVF